MATAKDEQNEASDRAESMARIHGSLMGLHLSLAAFAISSSSEEGVRQYIEILSIVKEAISQTAIEEDSNSLDEAFADEAGRAVEKMSDLLSKFISNQEVKDEH